jgi:CRP-like cAMP-binding protein
MENSDELSVKDWEENALIYDYDTPSFHAYYIIAGEVDIFTPRGLKLNSIGPSEVFGEASLLLDKKRSVTARAGKSGAKTKLIPKSYITDLQKNSPILSALLRNVQMRLFDSNEQSARYAEDIEKLIKLAKEQNEVSGAVTERLTKIQKRIKNDFFSGY